MRIVSFDTLTHEDKLTAIIRANRRKFYLDRELQNYQNMEGWWITLRGGRRVFVEARYVIRGDVSQEMAGEVIGLVDRFSPKLLSRAGYLSLEPAVTEPSWWIFEKDVGMLGYYNFDTRHITLHDSKYFDGKRHTYGGTLAHELAHSHLNRGAWGTGAPKRPRKERKLVDAWVDSVFEEQGVSSNYAWSSYYQDIELGHAENFAEWARARHEFQYAENKQRWNTLSTAYPGTSKSFLNLWKHYGGT